MFKKLFGPYPDEALLYSFDKIIGLYYKIDSKLKRANAPNDVPNDATLIADPIEEKIANVIDEPTTKKGVAPTPTDDKINDIILETTTKNDVVPSPTIQPVSYPNISVFKHSISNGIFGRNFSFKELIFLLKLLLFLCVL